MPTNQNAYNSRITDEALEKRFRDTFRAQGGAELIDDLYASGVIIPVVDFTQAAEGSQLPSNLQTAWDFSTGFDQVNNAVSTIISTPGFWKIDITCVWQPQSATPSVGPRGTVRLSDGITTKTIWNVSTANTGATASNATTTEESFIVFVRSNDIVQIVSLGTSCTVDAWYRQIADVSGNLNNPTGFTSS